MAGEAVNEFKRRIATVETLQEAAAQLDDVATTLGFGGVAYIYSPRPMATDGSMKIQSVRCISEKLDRFDKIYESKQYFRFDPVYQQCLRTTLPVIWTYRSKEHPLPRTNIRLTGVQTQLARECCRLGLANGLTVPIHGPCGELASVSFVSQRDTREFLGIVEDTYDEIFLLSHHFHNAAARLVASLPADPSQPLSQRELDCLRLVAHGKTNEMIATLLGLAEITIRFHLNNAKRKLGACNRSNAVAKATELGLLGPTR